jgi:virulence-associated protein VagC
MKAMAEWAKIIHDGGVQTIELPESCRFPDDQEEVLVRKEGEDLIVGTERKPRRQWSKEFLELLGTGTEDIERPPQPLITEIRNPFDDSEE